MLRLKCKKVGLHQWWEQKKLACTSGGAAPVVGHQWWDQWWGGTKAGLHQWCILLFRQSQDVAEAFAKIHLNPVDDAVAPNKIVDHLGDSPLGRFVE